MPHDSFSFDYNPETGFCLKILIENLGEKEQKILNKERKIITFNIISGVCFIYFFIEDLFCAKASFNPNLCTPEINIKSLESINSTVTVTVIDPLAKEEEKIKYYKTGSICSKAEHVLNAYFETVFHQQFDKAKYFQIVDEVYSNYTIQQLITSPTAIKCII